MLGLPSLYINGFPKATAKDVMQQLDKTQRLLEKHGALTEFSSTTYDRCILRILTLQTKTYHALA